MSKKVEEAVELAKKFVRAHRHYRNMKVIAYSPLPAHKQDLFDDLLKEKWRLRYNAEQKWSAARKKLTPIEMSMLVAALEDEEVL